MAGHADIEAPVDRLDRLLEGGNRQALALADRHQRLSRAALDAAVDAVAGGIAARIAPGERVAIWLPKSVEAVIAMLAVSRAGGVMVPVNPLLRARQVDHILKDSGAQLLLSHAPRAATLENADARALLTLEQDWDALHRAPPADVAPGGDALAALLYTSGSTGTPKGVMVSHRNLLLGAASVAHYLGTGADDRILSVLPLSFDFGLSQLTTGLLAGAAVVLLDYLAPRDVVQWVEREDITQLAAVPPLWMHLAALDWPDAAVRSLRTLSNSGGRLPVPTVRALRARFPEARLHLMYGLTEAFRSTTLPPELADSHPASIGRAIPNAEILVVHPDGQPTQDGEPGELVHCGPLVTQGYWQDPARTAQRFRPAPAHARLQGMAVWSGDTVVRDAAGLLTFVGRDDETIKTMGTRVSPTEVEELAHASGAVAEAVAIGVADAAVGQLVRLVAVPAGALTPADAEAMLRAFLRREAPPFLHPASIIWCEQLARGANGKLDRQAVRERFGQ